MVAAAVLSCPWALRPAVAAAAYATTLARTQRRPHVASLSLTLCFNRWSSGGDAVKEEPAGGSRSSYWHEASREPLMSKTLGQLVEEAAHRWPHHEAIVSVHEALRLTFSQTLDKADNLAAGLIGLGLKPGDMLGLCGPNSVEWYLTHIAAARAGLILVNINPAYQVPELEYCLTKVGVKALVMPESFKTQNYHTMLQAIAPELMSSQPGNLQSGALPDLRFIITISDNELPGCFKFKDLLKYPSVDVSEVHQLQRKIQPDAGCNLQFTSGTTGLPKGTLLSHHNVVNNAYFAAKRLGFHHKHHRICLQVPFFHCFGNVLGIAMALHAGSTLVLPSYTFQAEESINAIKKERCTYIYGTPTMYIDIISKSENRTALFSSLEFAIVAGSPCSPNLFHKIVNVLTLRKCYSVYGMTETSPLSFVPDYGDTTAQCSNTVGRVMDHCEVKVVDSENKIVPMGVPGELLVRGYSNMLCYYNDDDKTKEIMGQDRWLRTGDQFILHKDGYGEVVGRIKDMIIRGGENIFPREIEDYLITHQDVVDAQVLGVPDERFGEEICACVRLKPGSQLTSEELKKFCKGKIAHFKIPKYVKFMNDYPRTQSGKVQKFKLRDTIVGQL